MLPEMREVWLAAVRKYLPAGRKPRIIDIGSGTGRFSEEFSTAFGGAVTGVEPSDEMRKIAESKQSSGNIKYLKGGAEKLPIGDEKFDLAWLSMVIHHIKDRKACAAETARVLEGQGIAIVRNSFRGRLDGIDFFKYFPAALKVDSERLPAVEEVRSVFEGAGFVFVALEPIRQVFAASFRQYIDKLGKRGTSTLRMISDEEYHAGLARMEEVLKKGERSGSITEVIDMLVFKKT